jgi:hypothetical protein
MPTFHTDLLKILKQKASIFCIPMTCPIKNETQPFVGCVFYINKKEGISVVVGGGTPTTGGRRKTDDTISSPAEMTYSGQINTTTTTTRTTNTTATDSATSTKLPDK